MSSNENSRRGFLRGLASLPLIGGGVTLIGNPTAAAVPTSRQLLDSYEAWLFYERRHLRFERYGLEKADRDDGWDREWLFVHASMVNPDAAPVEFVKMANGGGRFHAQHHRAQPASNRAAVVLSAVGCDWQGKAW
jgi:hypothetical protein